ncbi:MAG: metallopeptidase family protein [Patescibacteria group bacterium]
MPRESFEKIVAEEFPRAVPERFRARIKNVAAIVEWEPDKETRQEEGLSEDETLLGLYRGIPNTLRGSEYGVGATLPDTITLFQSPIEEEAKHVAHVKTISEEDAVRQVIRDTIWHEVAHYFGMSEGEVRACERKAGT